MMTLPMARKTACALVTELTCLCLVRFDTLLLIDWRPSNFLRKTNANKRNIKIMGLLDSILSAVSGKSDASGEAAPLIGILSGLLAQSGGLQGLANKFSQSGQGDAFSSWVGMGENQPVSSNQIQQALGSDQVRALATKWEWIPLWPRTSWLNTCQRSWIN